jgi:hypothetical protein
MHGRSIEKLAGDLHHERHVLAPGAVVRIGDVLLAGDLAFARGDDAVGVHVRSVERAVAAVRGDVHERAVVVVDRDPAKLRRGRRRR